MEDAVEDIIVRTMGKLRKNAFGDDMEDAKNLPWTREQAWSIISKLSAKEEVRTIPRFRVHGYARFHIC